MSHSNTAHDPATAEEESAIAGTSLLPRIAGRFGKTLFGLVVTLFGLLVVTFAIARLVPIDPALAVVGPRGEIAAKLRARFDGIADGVSLTHNRAPDPDHWADVVAELKRAG